MTPSDFLDHFAASPDVHLHRIDLVSEAALLLQLDRERYSAATFLDDRALSAGTMGAWFPLAAVDERTRLVSPVPVHFVWHQGHVGSTLVTRLLEDVAGVLAIREPLPMRTLADAADSLSGADSSRSADRHAALVRLLLATWGRGYPDTPAVIVKAPSVTARAAHYLLDAAPESRSLYLGVSAETYVAGALAHGALVDLQNYGPGRMRRLQEAVSVPLPPLASLSPGELAAMSWLAEALTRKALVERFGERVQAVDFDAFLADVGAGAERMLEHLRLPAGSDARTRAAASPVLKRHAKAPGRPFSPDSRRDVLAASRQRNAGEIAAGIGFVERLAEESERIAATVEP